MSKINKFPGTDRKFMVTCTQEDFLMTEDDFEITVIDPYRRQRRITKQDCFWDSDGRYYFTLEKPLRGTYFAWFKGWYEDDDYDKQRRQFTDGQKLCEVGVRACRCGTATDSTPTGHQGHKGCQCQHVVLYTEVTTVSLDGDEYLADVDGKYILTSDGKRIAFKNPTNDKVNDMGKVRLNMTGDEFKTLIEGEKQNGEIDTLPEVMNAMKNQDDDGTTQLGNLTDEDMEKWFDDDPTNDDPEEPDADEETDQGE